MKKTNPKKSEGDVAASGEAVTGGVNDDATLDVTGAAEDSIESLREKVASLENSVLRIKADYQNLQRRGAIERSEAIRYANADLMRSLVAVIDDLERSIAAAKDSEKVEAVMDGVQLVYHNMVKAMREHGLEAIDAVGQPFDPKIHEAMMQQPSDQQPPGTVLSEIARGYKLLDRVVRPSKVIVSRAVGGNASENKLDDAGPADMTEEDLAKDRCAKESTSPSDG